MTSSRRHEKIHAKALPTQIVEHRLQKRSVYVLRLIHGGHTVSSRDVAACGASAKRYGTDDIVTCDHCQRVLRYLRPRTINARSGMRMPRPPQPKPR